MTAGDQGRFIALEGVDGSGKTTQARRLAQTIEAMLTFEPGATALGRELRAVLLDERAPAPRARAEALLMAADRAQHVTEVIRPALAAGNWVVTDRYSASTLAYQGFGRGLDIGALGHVTDFAADGLAPDLNILIDVPLEVARARLAQAAPDRLEGLDEAFFTRVRDGYRSLISRSPEAWAVVDGTPSPDAVAVAVFAAVTGRLRWTPGEGTPPVGAGHGR